MLSLLDRALAQSIHLNIHHHIQDLQLFRDYPNTLHCPCSKFSVFYSTFVSVKIQFHQVCSSEFVEQIWIDKVFEQYNQLSLPVDDHRNTLTFFWQIIAGFCAISKSTWSNIIANLNGSYIFSPVALGEQSIQSQVREALNNEQLSSQALLSRNLRILQRIISTSQFASAISTNFLLRYPDDASTYSTLLKMFTKKYGNCSCLNIDGCPHSATFNDTNGQLVSIPGMIADCLIVDSTLTSTLECYYSQSCISLLHQPLANSIQPLSADANKYFSVNSTIQTLFDLIMLDEVLPDIRYVQYYSQCQPSYCAYSYSRRFDVYYVITMVISFFGVLSTIIRVIAPFIASRYLQWRNKAASNVVVVQVIVREPNQSKSL